MYQPAVTFYSIVYICLTLKSVGQAKSPWMNPVYKADTKSIGHFRNLYLDLGSCDELALVFLTLAIEEALI